MVKEIVARGLVNYLRYLWWLVNIKAIFWLEENIPDKYWDRVVGKLSIWYLSLFLEPLWPSKIGLGVDYSFKDRDSSLSLEDYSKDT